MNYMYPVHAYMYINGENYTFFTMSYHITQKQELGQAPVGRGPQGNLLSKQVVVAETDFIQ